MVEKISIYRHMWQERFVPLVGLQAAVAWTNREHDSKLLLILEKTEPDIRHTFITYNPSFWRLLRPTDPNWVSVFQTRSIRCPNTLR